MMRTRWGMAAAIFGLAAIGIAVTPHQAKAWVGVGIYVPPVVVGPPVVYPPPVYAPPVYAPPVYAPPPPVVYAPPVYAVPRRIWIRPHWEGRYWVPGHWS